MKNNLIGALICLFMDISAWIYGGVVYSTKSSAFQKIFPLTFVVSAVGIIGLIIISFIFRYYEKPKSKYENTPSSFKLISAIIGLYLLAIFPLILFVSQ